MAEIIEVKNSREKAGGYSKELSEKLFEKKNDTKESFKEPSLKKSACDYRFPKRICA